MRVISQKRLFIEKQDVHGVMKNPWYRGIFGVFLRAGFTISTLFSNTIDIRAENVEFVFSNLPKEFDNVSVLFITDLHLDGVGTLADRVVNIVSEIDYDYCIMGGDYSDSRDQDYSHAYSQIKQIAEMLREKSRVFGILGNYDRYSIAKVLDGCGVEMLMNEGICLERNGDKIYLAGIDDSSHYKADDIALADSNAWDGAFKITVCHSPSKYKEAAKAGYSLYLTGDTHGGQICLPGGFVLFPGPTAKRKMVKGKWNYKSMIGYTSRGVGTSRINVRYFCLPEITVITLRYGEQ